MRSMSLLCRHFALSLSKSAFVLAPALYTLSAGAQTGQTVTWSGGNSVASWMTPANWSPVMAPLNNVSTTFTVVVPDNMSLRFDAPAGGKIEALSFGASSQLFVTNGQPLEVTGVAVMKGIVTGVGTGSVFKAAANTVVLSSNPRFYATNGALIELGGSTYTWDRFNASAGLLSAQGTGAKVDLRNLTSLGVSPGDGGAWTYSITARTNGIVDLSSLANLTGPGSDDILEVNADTGGQVKLGSVRQVNNGVRFNLGGSLFDLPEVTGISATTFNIRTGVVLNLPKLSTLSSSTLSCDSNATIASAVATITDTSISLGRGTQVQAPQLTAMDTVPLTLTGNAAFVAPNLRTYRNSSIPVDPSRNLQSGILTNIYGSWVNVSGGSSYTLGALEFTGAGWGNYTYPPKKVLSSSGPGSVLNAASMKSLRMTGADYVWDPDANTWRSDFSFGVVAEDQGVVNLSGLLEAYGGETASYGNNDWLVFRVQTGGNILLPNLKQALRRTGFEISIGQYDLPALEIVQTGKFTLADGTKINLPSLTNLDNTSIAFGFNSTFNAPQLRTFLNSDLNLAPGRIFTTAPFTNFNASRISVTSGSTLSVAATAYETNPDDRWSPTLFSADGTGSRLNFASIDRMRVYGAGGGAWTSGVTANNNGVIDLSGLDTLIGPDWGTYDNDDWLNLSVQNGGKILLNTLQEVTGHVRISVGAGQRQDLPNLTRLADGAVFSLAAGSTLVAPQLTDVANCSLSLGSAADLQISSLTNVYSSQIAVSGGRTLTVSAENYESPGMGNYTYPPRVPFSVEGAGSVLNAAAMKSMQIYGIDYGWDPLENTWRGDYFYSIFARNTGLADFSGLRNVYGGTTSYGNNDVLEFAATTGGTIRLGDLSVNRRVRLSAANPDSTLEFKSLYLRPPATLILDAATVLRIRGDFLFENTDVNSIVTEFATFIMDGVQPQSLEIGSADIGSSTTTFRRNFGYSQLVVGSGTQNSVLRLVDSLNNGARGTGGQPEALYLYGLSGQGLRLMSGSRLILNNLNCYGAVNSVMVDLRTLIPQGSNSVAFDGGYIANFGGPAITNLTPSATRTPPIASLEVSFNTPIQASSFTPSDVVITGPSGSIPATTLTQLDVRTWRISFASQTATGIYTVKVGPAINELAANLTGMDQDGDGLGGNPTDAFTGSFTLDGTPPSMLSAYALQGGTNVSIFFNEPVSAAFATNVANYLVNGAVPTRALLQSNGTCVILTVPALVGVSFNVSVSNQEDLLGNRTSQDFSGTILALSAVDIGSPGSNPRELGSTTSLAPGSFQTVAGGSDFFWNGNDAGHFVYERRSGDFDLRVRVSRLDKTPNENHAQAGLMWRETLAANSRHTYLLVTPTSGGNSYYGVTRATTAAGGVEWTYSNASARTGVPIPNAWVRLKREGSVFVGFRSTNGVDWVELGRQTNSFPIEGYVGMATSARNNNAGQSTIAWYEELSDFSPSIASHPQSQTVSSGTTVTFAAVARGVPALSYQWLFNGQPMAGATTNSLILNAVTTARVGDYRLVVTNLYGGATSQTATLVVDGLGLGGFEGDLAPAPNGNNSVTVADWVKVGRLVAALDTPLNTSEFVRADCAPRMAVTDLVLGDGRLTVADWTQCGRYAAVLDPLTAAGGPVAAAIPAPAPARTAKEVSGRSLELGVARAWVGGEVEVPLALTSQGDENALGFSVVYDPTRLSCIGAFLGKDSQGSMLQVNNREAANGVAAVVLSRPIGESFPAGVLEVARLRFSVLGDPGTADLHFADSPVTREVVDAVAEPLATAYVSGSVQAVVAPRFAGVQPASGGGIHLQLKGTVGEWCEVQFSSDMLSWKKLSNVQLSSEGCEVDDPGAAGQASRFYRLVPVE